MGVESVGVFIHRLLPAAAYNDAVIILALYYTLLLDIIWLISDR